MAPAPAREAAAGDERHQNQYGFFRPYVRDVIYRYLDRGDLHLGFFRVRCSAIFRILIPIRTLSQPMAIFTETAYSSRGRNPFSEIHQIMKNKVLFF